MSCKNTNCRARSNKFLNGCSALIEGKEDDTCPFYKTDKDYNAEIKHLIDNGHFVSYNSGNYENYLTNKK